MFELIQVGEKSYYIQSPAKIGIYKANDTDVYLIDSGNDKDAGRKVKKILDEKGWKLKGIVNTHSNADHIGGNRYLQNQFSCKIFAKGIEQAFIQYPVLEPSFLYGGYPCNDLRHKFLLATGSNVVDIDDVDFPKDLKVFSLKGHFFDMIGIHTPDDTVFLADCISSRSILEKYQISYIYDVQEYLNTLDKLENMKAKVFVPAHADASTDIKELVQYNRETVISISRRILDILKVPMNFEQLLKLLFDEYQLKMNFEQYVLVGSTIRSYLSWLKDQDKVLVSFVENQMIWSSNLRKI